MQRNSRLLARSGSAYKTPPVDTLSTAIPSKSKPAETEVFLCPAGTLLDTDNDQTDQRSRQSRLLAIAIRQRIESRLAGRVRDLSVRVAGNTIVLEGNCSTYYTKQLAQHAALGVLEDEQLDNEIIVAVPR